MSIRNRPLPAYAPQSVGVWIEEVFGEWNLSYERYSNSRQEVFSHIPEDNVTEVRLWWKKREKLLYLQVASGFELSSEQVESIFTSVNDANERLAFGSFFLSLKSRLLVYQHVFSLKSSLPNKEHLGEVLQEGVRRLSELYATLSSFDSPFAKAMGEAYDRGVLVDYEGTC